MDEQLKNEQRETAFEQVDSIWRKVSNLPKIIWVAVFVTALTTGLLTGGVVTFVHLNYGYPLSKMFGAVPSNTLGGFAEHEELERLRSIISNKSQRRDTLIAANKELRERSHQAELNLALKENECNSLSKIKHERKESLEIMLAVLFDDTTMLKKSERSNPFRKKDTYGKAHVFTFNKWNYPWPEKLLNRAIEIGSTNVLGYIANQPNWSEHIPKELECKTMQALTQPHKVTPLVAQRHRRKEAMRKVRLFQAWYHDNPSFVDGTRGFPVISIDSLSDAWLADFLKNCQRDNRTNMLNYLQLNLDKNKIVPAKNGIIRNKN